MASTCSAALLFGTTAAGAATLPEEVTGLDRPDTFARAIEATALQSRLSGGEPRAVLELAQNGEDDDSVEASDSTSEEPSLADQLSTGGDSRGAAPEGRVTRSTLADELSTGGDGQGPSFLTEESAVGAAEEEPATGEVTEEEAAVAAEEEPVTEEVTEEEAAVDAAEEEPATAEATEEEAEVGAMEEAEPATGEVTDDESAVGAAEETEPATGDDAVGQQSAVDTTQ